MVKMCICVKAYWALAFLLLTQKTSNASETLSLERNTIFSKHTNKCTHKGQIHNIVRSKNNTA